MRYLLLGVQLFLLSSIALAKKENIGVTISGGVSLGAYEGGFSYYLTESLKQNKLEYKYRPKYYTGASAGGINSVLTLIETCTFGRSEIDDSLFWKIWVPIGLKQLVNEQKMGPINIFTREKMRAVAESAKKPSMMGLRKVRWYF